MVKKSLKCSQDAGCVSVLKIALYILFIIGNSTVLTVAASERLTESSAFSLAADNKTDVGVNYSVSNFSGTDRIELENRGNITGVSVTGSIVLLKDNSFARIILVDVYGNEYLALEMHPLLNPDAVVRFSNYCDETALLNTIEVDYISVEAGNADVAIVSASFSSDPLQRDTAKRAEQRKLDQQYLKIDQLNQTINARNLSWVAGETLISGMTYAEKKKLMGGKLPNLCGFDYYIGGIFVVPAIDSSVETKKRSQYTSEFSWRDRHGTDWMTPVKNQSSCGSCWAFAGTATVEHHLNLYFNQKIDADLSEQEIVSCNTNNYSCKGGNTFSVYNYATTTGMSDEACFQYTASDLDCADKCTNPSEIITINGYTRVDSDTDDSVKHALINNGPLSTGISTWAHAVGLVGYKTMKAGDRVFIKATDVSEWYTIPDGDSLIGQTAWLIKNSWGSWGDSGYAWIVAGLNNVQYTNGPVTSQNYSDTDIQCTDNDNDGYYYWGSGAKPAHCPSSPQEADGDDSNPDLGPMDAFGILTDISEYVAISSPAAGSVSAFGTDITIEAVAKTTSGTIAKIEFFQNGTKIGEDSTSPYSVVWNNAPVGCYSLTSTAYKQSGETISATSVSIMVRGLAGAGHISRSVWTGIDGTSIASLMNDSHFQDVPDLSDTLSVFETPENTADQYGSIISGYLHPPVTGDYVFWISGDDNCELHLSTDITKTGSSLIASVPGWTNAKEWEKFSEQKSVIVTLIEGEAYFIEARHKEGGGGDHVAVQWQIPGFTTGIIDGDSLSPYDAKYDADYTVTFEAGDHGSLSGDSNQSVRYGQDCTTVSAIAETGYHFVGWTGDYSGTTNPLTIRNVTGAMTIRAEFEEDQPIWTVRFTTDGNGTITGDSEQQIEDGQECSSVTAIANENYTFSGWTGDYESSNVTINVSAIHRDMEITANFKVFDNNGDTNSDGNNSNGNNSGNGSSTPDSSQGGCFISSMKK